MQNPPPPPPGAPNSTKPPDGSTENSSQPQEPQSPTRAPPRPPPKRPKPPPQKAPESQPPPAEQPPQQQQPPEQQPPQQQQPPEQQPPEQQPQQPPEQQPLKRAPPPPPPSSRPPESQPPPAEQPPQQQQPPPQERSLQQQQPPPPPEQKPPPPPEQQPPPPPEQQPPPQQQPPPRQQRPPHLDDSNVTWELMPLQDPDIPPGTLAVSSGSAFSPEEPQLSFRFEIAFTSCDLIAGSELRLCETIRADIWSALQLQHFLELYSVRVLLRCQRKGTGKRIHIEGFILLTNAQNTQNLEESLHNYFKSPLALQGAIAMYSRLARVNDRRIKIDEDTCRIEGLMLDYTAEVLTPKSSMRKASLRQTPQPSHEHFRKHVPTPDRHAIIEERRHHAKPDVYQYPSAPFGGWRPQDLLLGEFREPERRKKEDRLDAMRAREIALLESNADPSDDQERSQDGKILFLRHNPYARRSERTERYSEEGSSRRAYKRRGQDVSPPPRPGEPSDSDDYDVEEYQVGGHS